MPPQGKQGPRLRPTLFSGSLRAPEWLMVPPESRPPPPPSNSSPDMHSQPPPGLSQLKPMPGAECPAGLPMPSPPRCAFSCVQRRQRHGECKQWKPTTCEKTKTRVTPLYAELRKRKGRRAELVLSSPPLAEEVRLAQCSWSHKCKGAHCWWVSHQPGACCIPVFRVLWRSQKPGSTRSVSSAGSPISQVCPAAWHTAPLAQVMLTQILQLHLQCLLLLFLWEVLYSVQASWNHKFPALRHKIPFEWKHLVAYLEAVHVAVALPPQQWKLLVITNHQWATFHYFPQSCVGPLQPIAYHRVLFGAMVIQRLPAITFLFLLADLWSNSSVEHMHVSSTLCL